MSATTGIEWTDATWNPVRGCSHASRGCFNCYAEAMAGRFAGNDRRTGKDLPYTGFVTLPTSKLQYARGSRGGTTRVPIPARWTGKVELVLDALGDPVSWQEPRRIFVASMSDVFHESLPDHAIDAICAVMAATPRHTYQVLTKRPERAAAWFRRVESEPGRFLADAMERVGFDSDDAMHAANWVNGWSRYADQPDDGNPLDGTQRRWPLPNVWLGTSIEDQVSAERRIPHLLGCPAAIRFVSVEPLLEPVDLKRWMWPTHDSWPSRFKTPEQARAAGATVTRHRQALVAANRRFLDWVITGGESGSRARQCDVAWIRSIVRDCHAADVACFVKQLGTRQIIDGAEVISRDRGGDPSTWPEDLRVRQFPARRGVTT